MDFEGGTPGRTVVSDVAFIQDENREILVVGASTDNNIVLVDLKTFATRKINVAPSVVESTGGGARKLELAVDTDYLWINGGESQEAYILKVTGGIESAVVEKTLSNVAAGNMLYVNNYERLRAAKLAETQIKMSEGLAEVTKAEPSISTVSSVNMANIEDEEPSPSQSNTLGIVAVALGALGFLAGLGALVLVLDQKTTASALANPTKKQDVEEALEVKTLGSKRVN